MSLKDNLNALGKTQKSAISIPIEQEVTNIDKDDNESVATNLKK